ncbi:MAG: hypothetical protein WAU78_09295 [Roseiarcus sp.]|jgi:hypothetical protein
MLKTAISFTINRLFIVAMIALVMNAYFQTHCGIGTSYVEQFNQWVGIDELLRVLDHYN